MGQYSNMTQIANLALSLLGEKPISSISATDATNARLVALQRWQGGVLEKVIRDLKIQVSKKEAVLVLAEENPTDEWQFAYFEPSDLYLIHRILSGNLQDTQETIVQFRKRVQEGAAAANITGATKATECVLTVSGLVDGQLITIASVTGMTELNGNTYIVSDATATTCKIKDRDTGEYVDSTGFTTYTGPSGTATPIAHVRILCNVDTPTLEYGYLPDITVWPADWAVAIARLWAWLAGPEICGAEKADTIAVQRVEYLAALRNAGGNDFNEQAKGPRPPARLSDARN